MAGELEETFCSLESLGVLFLGFLKKSEEMQDCRLGKREHDSPRDLPLTQLIDDQIRLG